MPFEALEPPTAVMRATIRAVFSGIEQLGRAANTGDPELTTLVAGHLGVSFDEAEARVIALDDYMRLLYEQQYAPPSDER